MFINTLPQANLISLLGLESLPEDQKKELIMSAVELVEERVMERVLGTLDSDKRTQLLSIMEEENEDKMLNFFAENSLDLVAMYDEEIVRLKMELASLAKEE